MDQADAGVQVLVLDDCSTDGSWALMQQLDQRWPGRLQLMQHERNAGLSAARNTMIEAATGDYLWFLDSDDKLLPGAIAGLSAIVKQQDRKSTRLNSSHSQISYAVFCLKKKK